MADEQFLHFPMPDRVAAGRTLAGRLQRWKNLPDVIVLALPRGGVPVAFEVASALGVRLDLIIVRKLGVPGHEELAMGAIASGEILIVNEEVIRQTRTSAAELADEIDSERQELTRRERAYRGSRASPVLRDQTVILVDDGLATGATMRAAIAAVRQQQPAAVIVAVPVAPQETVAELSSLADQVVCLHTPVFFMAIGRWYEDFSQVSDDTVTKLLSRAWSQETAATPHDVGKWGRP